MTSRTRNVAFKALLVGLASLVLVFAGPVSTMLAGPSKPPPGFLLVLVQGQANLCADGKPVQGAKVVLSSKKKPDLKVETITNSEGKFSASAILFGAHVQKALSDLGVEFPGFMIGKIASFVISLPFVGAFIQINVCLQPATCACTGLTAAVDALQGGIVGYTPIRTAESEGDRIQVNYLINIPYRVTMTCAGVPGGRCSSNVNVTVTTTVTQDTEDSRSPVAFTRVTAFRPRTCNGRCPVGGTLRGGADQPFSVEGKREGFMRIRVLPFTATFTLTFASDCLPAPIVIVRRIEGGGPPPPPPPPPPVTLPIPLPIIPNIWRDPYVAEVESVDPLPNALSVNVRVGNNGIQPARVRLNVTVLFEDGTRAVGVMDNLVLPPNLESTVPVVVPISANAWPPVSMIAEIVPYDPDDNLDNNRAEWP